MFERAVLFVQRLRPFLDQLLQMISVPLEFRLYPLALEERPHALHQQRQLANIRLIVVLVLVPDTRYDDNVSPIKNGNIHVTSKPYMTLGNPFLQRIRGSVVIGNNWFPLPSGLPHRPVVSRG